MVNDKDDIKELMQTISNQLEDIIKLLEIQTGFMTEEADVQVFHIDDPDPIEDLRRLIRKPKRRRLHGTEMVLIN